MISRNNIKNPSVKILVVDDQFSDRELAKDLLEMENFSVETAESGEEAIEKLKNKNFNIVLSDLMMPKIDGIQLTKYIKENKIDTEVIIMTAYATIETAKEAIKIGAFDYLTKPLDRFKISVVIENCLEAHRLSKETKLLQQKLFNIEKMNAISKLSSAIAHQIKNPLFVIMSTAELLKEKFSYNEEILKNLDIIITNIKIADKIVHRLLRSTNVESIKLEKVVLFEVFQEVLKLLSLEIQQKNIKVFLEIPKDFAVLGDYSILQQCFLNIIMNSIEAIENLQGFIKVKSYKISDEKIIIEIEDNGKGISEDKINNIFDPFFTTKQKGSGLGLFYVYQMIVNYLSGDIKVESKVSKGTKFIIALALFKE
ncbi:MAG: response regulator [Endomicrobiia bacterium]